MKPRSETIARLMAVQASWTYERMAGIGVGHAAAPLLRDLYAGRSVRERRDAVARSADFFNCHPYLAGVAVGAVVKSERDHVPGETITRLRTALSGPLGALGDQLIWAGWVPALIGAALVAVPWAGVWAVVAVVLIHNGLRVWLTVWGLDLGLREGIQVGAALQASWLPRAAVMAQRAAAFTVGVALPVVVATLMAGVARRIVLAAVLIGVVGAAATLLPITRTRVTGLRFGTALVFGAVVLAWWPW
ncbi:MAG: PTS system mannose/fructose/sorbose family transporter subunit IID [Gemmatimonadales bacterium]